MDKIHDLLTRQVPREIASHIFAQCISSYPFPYKREVISQPLVLGAVCKSWRDIAWTTPQLWTTIAIRTRSIRDPALHLELLDQWIARSGQLPLYISFKTPRNSTTESLYMFYPLVDLVNRYSSRWKGLHLFVSSSLFNRFTGDGGNISILSALTLVLPPYERGKVEFSLKTLSPQPQSVKLCGIAPSSLDIKWNNVTWLEVSLHLDELLGIFPDTDQLVSCTIFNCFRASTVEYHIPQSPIILRCLQNLDIRSCSVDPAKIIEAITTPCLRHFYTNLSSEGLPVHSFNSFIIRSSCNLEALRLSGSIAGDGELVTILRYLPSSLKQLFLEPDLRKNARPWLTKEVENLFKLPRSPSKCGFFPDLESFQYEGPQTFSWPDIIGTFFDPPSAPPSNHRLQILDIKVTQDVHLTPIDPNTLRSIHELQESGLKITITKGGKRQYRLGGSSSA